jgi:hypothetical protein
MIHHRPPPEKKGRVFGSIRPTAAHWHARKQTVHWVVAAKWFKAPTGRNAIAQGTALGTI